jgi:hypothetical protein
LLLLLLLVVVIVALVEGFIETTAAAFDNFSCDFDVVFVCNDAKLAELLLLALVELLLLTKDGMYALNLLLLVLFWGLFLICFSGIFDTFSGVFVGDGGGGRGKVWRGSMY